MATLSPDLRGSDRLLVIDQRLPFDDLDALLSFATVFVGNDSGPKHLAALRGTPVVSIHCARIGWAEWGQEQSGVVISRRVPCAGCALFHDADECGKGIARVTDIDVAEVLAATYHPTYDSVTRHFYDNGWRGINIEPSRDLFPAFVEERSRDINIQAAVTEQAGEATFFAVEGQLGTLDHNVAENHDNAGLTRDTYVVPAVTLTQICEQHAPRDIHSLKIDVEGHEAAALRGMNFQRFRPWVLVVEATEPNPIGPSDSSRVGRIDHDRRRHVCHF